MAEKVLCLAADPWEMADEKTGAIMKGVSLWYVNEYRDGDLGQKPTKVSVTPDIATFLSGKMPCIAELDYGSRPGAMSKAALTVIAAKVLKPFDLSALLSSPSVAAAAR